MSASVFCKILLSDMIFFQGGIGLKIVLYVLLYGNTSFFVNGPGTATADRGRPLELFK